MKSVVLLSGNGSNLQALIHHQQGGNLHTSIVGVISDNPQAYGLVRAQQAGIPCAVVDYHDYHSRDDFCNALVKKIQYFQGQLVVLAGFMRLLSESFVKTFYGHLINIHPSILPKYPGLHTHQKVLANHDVLHGITIHFVNEKMDEGPIICQRTLTVTPTDTVATLKERIHQLEHRYYPEVVKGCAEGIITLKKDKVWFNNQLITDTEYYLL